MAKPTPATIRFAGNTQEEVERVLVENSDPDRDLLGDSFEDISAENIENDFLFDNNEQFTNTLRFHAVVSEDHKAQTQITKFPVQNGFEVSNHAIRKNRVITLEGVISSVLLDNTEQARYDIKSAIDKEGNKESSNAVKDIYEQMERLVQEAVPCEVTTNLGVYDPVVFTKISTKQQVGYVDSALITLTGEEIQVAEVVSKTGPKELSFTVVPSSKRTAVINELKSSGFEVPDTSIISQAVATLGESFSFITPDSAGSLYDVTYIQEAWDGLSNYTYSVFTGNTDVFSIIDDVSQAVQDSLNSPLIPSVNDLLGGLDSVTNCLLSDGGSVITEELENVVDTALGELEQSVYGAKQDIVNLGKDSLQKALIGTTLDCVAVGMSDVVGYGNSENVEDFVDEVLVGIKGVGDVGIGAIGTTASNIANSLSKTMTFTKIENPVKAPLDTRGEENAPST